MSLFLTLCNSTFFSMTLSHTTKTSVSLFLNPIFSFLSVFFSCLSLIFMFIYLTVTFSLSVYFVLCASLCNSIFQSFLPLKNRTQIYPGLWKESKSFPFIQIIFSLVTLLVLWKFVLNKTRNKMIFLNGIDLQYHQTWNSSTFLTNCPLFKLRHIIETIFFISV